MILWYIMMWSFIKSIRWLTLVCLFYGVGTAYALVVEVPPSQWYQDIIVWPTTRISANQSTWMWFIQLINQYLWFSIAVIAFAVLVYGWFKLLTVPAWDSDALNTATKIMTNAAIGIVVAMLSYAAVRVVVNLF